MSHKELCMGWVEDRMCEADDGKWYAQACNDDEPFGGPFDTEEQLTDFLWDEVMKCDWADFGFMEY